MTDDAFKTSKVKTKPTVSSHRKVLERIIEALDSFDCDWRDAALQARGIAEKALKGLPDETPGRRCHCGRFAFPDEAAAIVDDMTRDHCLDKCDGFPVQRATLDCTCGAEINGGTIHTKECGHRPVETSEQCYLCEGRGKMPSAMGPLGGVFDCTECGGTGKRRRAEKATAPREWVFDRYRNGKLKAQGVKVHAATQAEAWELARSLLSIDGNLPTDELRLQENGS
jgi:hypothetical protein